MAQVNIRIDDTLKKQGEELFQALGLSFSAAVNVFVSQAVREGSIPFKLTTKSDPFYSSSNMEVLRQSIQAANEGKLTEHELIDETNRLVYRLQDENVEISQCRGHYNNG